jgi:hypothetical protein
MLKLFARKQYFFSVCEHIVPMLLSVPDPAVNYGVKEEATWEENTDVAQMSVGRLS